MSDRYTLFGMSSPNVRKVGIMLEELGADYVLQYVAVFGEEQFGEDISRLNPLQRVPILRNEADGAVVFESGAILIYLAERHGRFLPASGPARYEVMEWLMVQMASIGPMLGQYNHFAMLPREAHAYAAARYQGQAEKLYRVIDRRMAGRDYIAGDAYSIADMATYPWATYLEQHRFSPDEFPELVRWRAAIAARPSVPAMNARFTEAFDKPTVESLKTASPDNLDRFFGRAKAAPFVDYRAAMRLK
jgi:GST-like protein